MNTKLILPPAISQILDDRESGSVSLLNRLVSALDNELDRSDLPAVDFSDLLIVIREKLRHFAAIENFLALLIMHCGQENTFPGEALSFIEEYRSYWEKGPEKITENFLHQCEPEGKTILTHSHSQTVIALLHQLHRRQIPFRVIQTLSVPGEEGKISHERMLQMKLRSQLIKDKDANDALKHTDLVLMGCDALLQTEFLNKTGTASILRQAKELNIPSFLVAESRKKISSPSWKERLPDHNLFEWVPLSFVQAIVSEKNDPEPMLTDRPG